MNRSGSVVVCCHTSRVLLCAFAFLAGVRSVRTMRIPIPSRQRLRFGTRALGPRTFSAGPRRQRCQGRLSPVRGLSDGKWSVHPSASSVNDGVQELGEVETYIQYDDDHDDDHDYEYEGRSVLWTLRDSTDRFEKAGVPEPLLSSCHLLAWAIGLPWADGFHTLQQAVASSSRRREDRIDIDIDIDENDRTLSFSQRLLDQTEAKLFARMCRRRLRHEPLQYVLGRWDFLDFTLRCRRPTLCPRPETEELVEIVRRELDDLILSSDKNFSDTKLRILDVGCGTGAIGIALGRSLENVEITAIDVSPDAVDLTAENAAELLSSLPNNTRFETILASASDFLSGTDKPFFDVVVSNPPYIPPRDMESLDKTVKEFEDARALCGGGEDGMNVIRTIVDRLPDWLHDGGICWMEVDTHQPALLRDMLPHLGAIVNSTGVGVVTFEETRKDLCGRDRFVKLSVRKDKR